MDKALAYPSRQTLMQPADSHSEGLCWLLDRIHATGQNNPIPLIGFDSDYENNRVWIEQVQYNDQVANTG